MNRDAQIQGARAIKFCTVESNICMKLALRNRLGV